MLDSHYFPVAFYFICIFLLLTRTRAFLLPFSLEFWIRFYWKIKTQSFFRVFCIQFAGSWFLCANLHICIHVWDQDLVPYIQMWYTSWQALNKLKHDCLIAGMNYHALLYHIKSHDFHKVHCYMGPVSKQTIVY